LEKQDKLQCKYTGGTVLHLYTNENFTSPIACKNFVKTVIENYKLPYITVSPTFSTCNKHGYLSGNQLECPYCGQKVLTWTRVMGYYRPVDSFNVGKKGEYEQRVYFKQNSSS
jgi:ribonucleoside-triphosphate reductase